MRSVVPTLPPLFLRGGEEWKRWMHSYRKFCDTTIEKKLSDPGTNKIWVERLARAEQHDCWESDNVTTDDWALQLLSWAAWLVRFEPPYCWDLGSASSES